MKKALIIICVLSLFLTGCTSLNRFADKNKEYFSSTTYPATKVDLSLIKDTEFPLNIVEDYGAFALFRPVRFVFGLINLPLSVLLDTIFLPSDIKNIEPSEVEQ